MRGGERRVRWGADQLRAIRGGAELKRREGVDVTKVKS